MGGPHGGMQAILASQYSTAAGGAGSHEQGHYQAEESLAKCPTSIDKYGGPISQVLGTGPHALHVAKYREHYRYIHNILFQPTGYLSLCTIDTHMHVCAYVRPLVHETVKCA